MESLPILVSSVVWASNTFQLDVIGSKESGKPETARAHWSLNCIDLFTLRSVFFWSCSRNNADSYYNESGLCYVPNIGKDGPSSLNQLQIRSTHHNWLKFWLLTECGDALGPRQSPFLNDRFCLFQLSLKIVPGKILAFIGISWNVLVNYWLNYWFKLAN